MPSSAVHVIGEDFGSLSKYLDTVRCPGPDRDSGLHSGNKFGQLGALYTGDNRTVIGATGYWNGNPCIKHYLHKLRYNTGILH